MKISLITVCFNSAKTIAKTLHSVRQQSYLNIEHIVIDGGSNDDTLRIISTEGCHVAKLVSENDNGIYDAMNKGILLATGDIVGFINSDDFYASNEVCTKVAQVFKDPTVDACYGDLCYVGYSNSLAIKRYWQSSEFQLGAFERGWCPPHPTFFVRREIYERYGVFNLGYKIAADVELMMRFLETHKLRAIYIQEVLVNMRLGGRTNQSFSNIFIQNLEILRALRSHGLRSSVVRLVGCKLMSRGLQFFMRPSQR